MEHEKYELAAAIAILTFDEEGLRVSDLMDWSLDHLNARREELLATIDEDITMSGFYEVKPWVDAAWLATQLQTEFGSYVAAGEHLGTKAIVAVTPGS